MTGTIVNTACIIIGSVVGSQLRRGVSPKYQKALFTAIGICSILLGANAFIRNMPQSQYPVLFIVCLALGTVIGTRLDLNARFARLIDRRPSSSTTEHPLSQGLSTGILLYCIGTFSMVGPVMSALQGDNTYLYTNATLDLITSTVLASTYGIGMALAAPVLFCWQGLFYLIATLSGTAISPALMAELSIVGGVLITASGFSIMQLKDCKTLNMLPSLFLPPVFFLLHWLYTLIF